MQTFSQNGHTFWSMWTLWSNWPFEKSCSLVMSTFKKIQDKMRNPIMIFIILMMYLASWFFKILNSLFATIWRDIETYFECWIYKECINILLSFDSIFHLWNIVLVEWERFNILDGSSDVLAKLQKLIGKLAFGCFANLKENQLKKLTRGFISQ